MASTDPRVPDSAFVRRRTTVLLFLGLLGVYLVTATWIYRVSIDTEAVSLPAWWFAQNGTFDLSGWTTSNPWIVETSQGVRSNRLPGAIFTNVPAYLLLSPTAFSVIPSAVTAALVTATAMTLVYLALRAVVAQHIALLATLVLAFATGTWTVSADAAWTHGPAQLGLALGLYGASRGRYAVSGLGFAWSILTRPHTAVIAACVGVAESLEQRRWRPVLVTGATAFLGVLGLFAYHRITLGQWSLLGSYSANADAALNPVARAWLDDVSGLFISPERGILIYSTFVLLLLPGIPRAWRHSPAWVKGAAVGGVVYLGVQLSGNVFHGGSAFYGYRLPLEALVALTPLLALSAEAWTLRDAPRRRVFAFLVTLSVWLHALGAVTYGADEYDPLPWERFAPVDVVRQASAVQLIAATALAALVFATITLIWLKRRPSQASEDPSGAQPDDPTTTPVEPTPDLVAPSPANPAGR